MGIIELLRRLALAARSRDERTARSTLALAQHHGWMLEVNAAVRLMPTREAAFVLELLTPPSEARVAGGGGGYLPTNNAHGLDPFPRTAEHMRIAAGGFGTWAAGYLGNVGYGNIPSVFGTPATLTAAGTPAYERQGPRAGTWAVGLDSNTDAFEFGDTYNITATDDFAFAWAGYHAAAPGGVLMGKYDGGTSNGYFLQFDGAGNLYWRVIAAGVTTDAVLVGHPIAAHYVGICVIDRSTGKQRIVARTLSGLTTISAETTITAASTANAAILAVGASPWLVGTTDARLAAFWVAHGSAACTAMSANLSAVSTSLVSYLTR